MSKPLLSRPVHGVPYEDAKAYGSKALPDLVRILYDKNIEKYRLNVVLTMGMIADPSAVKPLREYLYSLKGEISYPTFISVLAIFQAFGYLAQNGNQESMKILMDWSDTNYLNRAGLSFKHNEYSGEAMGALISSMAIQGLGITGMPEALKHLEELGDPRNTKYRSNLKSYVQSAINLNRKVKTVGSIKVFGKENNQWKDLLKPALFYCFQSQL